MWIKLLTLLQANHPNIPISPRKRVSLYHLTLCDIPEDFNLSHHCHENLRSHNIINVGHFKCPSSQPYQPVVLCTEWLKWTREPVRKQHAGTLMPLYRWRGCHKHSCINSICRTDTIAMYVDQIPKEAIEIVTSQQLQLECGFRFKSSVAAWK